MFCSRNIVPERFRVFNFHLSLQCGNNEEKLQEQTSTKIDVVIGFEPTSGESETDEVTTSPETTQTVNKVLVAYFSATSTTKTIAEFVKDAVGADLYDITAAVVPIKNRTTRLPALP